MRYTESELSNTLQKRLEWYQKAIAISQKDIPMDIGFSFPDGNKDVWKGAMNELYNTIAMIK